jgi:adenine deaminase
MGAVRRTFRTLDDVGRLIAVARGQVPPDLLVHGGEILNVYSGERLQGSIAAAAGRIAYVGPRALAAGPSTIGIDGRGLVAVPGYIDPHAHPQAMFTPDALARAVLPLGTTTVVADTLPYLYLADRQRTSEILTRLSALPVQFYWFLRLHSQSHNPHDEWLLDEDRLDDLLQMEEIRTVGELTRWPLVYGGDGTLLARMARGLAAGRRIEGHAPGVSADRVQVLAAAGVSSDHEAITAEEALDRLRAGLYVMLRHGSLRPDLPALASIATGARAHSGRLMLTPDAPTAPFIRDQGYMDHLVEAAIHLGIDPIAVYQMVTVNPAMYYGLDEELGGLAPGRRADILLLEDVDRPRPRTVIAGGRIAAQDGRLVAEFPDLPWREWLGPVAAGAWRPDSTIFTLDGLPSPVPAMHLENAVITVRSDVDLADGVPDGVQRLVLLDYCGRWRCRALLSGFARTVGGLASTYATAGGVYVIGQDPLDMAVAASRALDLGGGVVLAEGGQVVFELALPLGGLMSPLPLEAVAGAVERLTALLQARGYAHHDISYTLLFLGFDSLPYVRLTHRGLWDVMAGREIVPREDL